MNRASEDNQYGFMQAKDDYLSFLQALDQSHGSAPCAQWQ